MDKYNTSNISGAGSSTQGVVNPSNPNSAPSHSLVSFTADELEGRRTEWTSQEQAYHQQTHYQRPPSVHKDDPVKLHHWDYLKKGAIPQPPDGADVKLAGLAARCLTCIRYNRPCYGTGVENGECETCRRLHGGEYAKKRTAKGGRQIFSNTSEGMKNRKGGIKKRSQIVRVTAKENNLEVNRRTSETSAQEADKDDALRETKEDGAQETPAVTAITPAPAGPDPTIDRSLLEAEGFRQEDVTLVEWHIFELQDAVSLQMMQGAASKMVEQETMFDDPSRNLQTFFDIATSWISTLYAGPAETLFERLDGIRALDRFVVILSRMSQEGDGLSPLEILNMASVIVE